MSYGSSSAGTGGGGGNSGGMAYHHNNNNNSQRRHYNNNYHNNSNSNGYNNHYRNYGNNNNRRQYQSHNQNEYYYHATSYNHQQQHYSGNQKLDGVGTTRCLKNSTSGNPTAQGNSVVVDGAKSGPMRPNSISISTMRESEVESSSRSSTDKMITALLESSDALSLHEEDDRLADNEVSISSGGQGQEVSGDLDYNDSHSESGSHKVRCGSENASEELTSDQGGTILVSLDDQKEPHGKDEDGKGNELRNNSGRRYNYSYNNNNYNNFRNYGNNNRRRNFHPNSQTDNYYHHNQNQYNNNGYHNGNNWYYNNYSRQKGNSEGYNGYRKTQGVGTNGYSEFEEPWPAKRGNWINGTFGFPSGNYFPWNARNLEANPASGDISLCDVNNFAGAAQTRDIILNNGSVIAAQPLGSYDYFVQHHNMGGPGPYPGFAHGNYYYNGYGSNERGEEGADGTPVVQTLSVAAPPTPTVSNESACSPDSGNDSPATEKTSDWPDDGSGSGTTEESDCEGEGSVHTSASTRCHSPEEYHDLPALTNDSYRMNNNYMMYQKDFSPFQSFSFRLQRRLPREFFEDLEPDEIIKQFSRILYKKDNPFNNAAGNSFTPLDHAIWKKYTDNQQTIETFRKKVELWRDIYRLVRYLSFIPEFKSDPRNLPCFGLQVVGSTLSGFGSNSSDVDMCLIIREAEVDQRFEAVERLSGLSQALSSLQFIENVEMIYAKVPILKFRDAHRRLDVDLNCNNFVGIRNTHLLYAYAQMDWRLRPLVLVVKLWAEYHRINDAKMMTISSYSLVLMVIHFLQHGLEEPVLPNLQAMYPERFNPTVPILAVTIHDVLPQWESKNAMGLGELLTLFLEYYGRKFDYNKHVVSVRTGGTIPVKLAAQNKNPKNDFHCWKLLCIEEPYDRTNTARSVYDKNIFERIISIFEICWQRLDTSQDLGSIFKPV